MDFRIGDITESLSSCDYSVLKVSSLETGVTFSIKIHKSMLDDVDKVKLELRRRHDEIVNSNSSVDCEIKIGNIL